MPGFKMSFVVSIIVMLALVGCANAVQTDKQAGNEENQEENEKIVVYTTVFPIYDFARIIGGEHTTVKSIIPPGAEAHEFEPSPKDMAELYEADLFIYNGAGFETWIEKALSNIDKSKTTVKEAVEDITMLNGAHEEDEHAHGEDENGNEHVTVDPTIWLDPVRAKKMAENIYDAIAAVDTEQKDEYRKNYEDFIGDLETLHSSYENVVGNAQKREFVVAHAAFSYMAERYDLEQIAVSGLSPSDEPTQKEIEELIMLIEEHDIKYIAFEELIESRIVQTVQKETATEGVVLNPIENVTKEQFANGTTYIDIMEENLETLKKVLEVNE